MKLRGLGLAGLLGAWLLGGVGPRQAIPYESDFKVAAGDRWLDRVAQAKAESGFNPAAQSWVIDRQGRRVPCAYGIMQFTLPTWSWAIQQGWAPAGSTPLDPVLAIPAGHAYMRWLEARTAGWDPALGAYNAGLGSVRKAERLAPQLGLTGEGAWLRALVHVTGEANSKQTRDYIARIHRFRAEYRAQRGE